MSRQPAPQLTATVEQETLEALDVLGLQLGLTRAGILRMAVFKLLDEHGDPFSLAYAEGIRASQHDIGPHMQRVFAALRETGVVVREYCELVRNEARKVPQQ